jgi:hypothetical protein
MVEYALLLAGNSLQVMSVGVGNWLAGLDWSLITYVVLGLVAIRIAAWAFRMPT